MNIDINNALTCASMYIIIIIYIYVQQQVIARVRGFFKNYN